MPSKFQKVKKYKQKRSGKCPILAFLLIAIITPITLWLGIELALYIIGLINVDIIILTIGIIWCAGIAGASLGNSLGGTCRNMIALSFALVPLTLVCLFWAAIFFGSDTGDFTSTGWNMIEAVFILAMPVIVFFHLKGEYYCEKCLCSYDIKDKLWYAAAPPYEEILHDLSARQWNAGPCPEEKPSKEENILKITAEHCPKCNDSVLHAYFKKPTESSEVLIFSEFIEGNVFAPLCSLMEKKTSVKSEDTEAEAAGNK
ncbi:hypothetical protein [Desulfopila sp. IMCC35008]|uniref:hypothetical protein n=1 Tax=Desulfopila sp. IMCC35008 TaxID=2653858 RepID=UPI0013D0B311|nr:hypothetical protein [Desulfopila sp. IMCC35008]